MKFCQFLFVLLRSLVNSFFGIKVFNPFLFFTSPSPSSADIGSKSVDSSLSNDSSISNQISWLFVLKNNLNPYKIQIII